MKKSKKFFSSKKKGFLSETIAYYYLKLLGYNIIDRNFHTEFGELDIIAEKKGIIFIIEVKSRFRKSSWHPLDAIDIRKKKKLQKLANYYLKVKKLFNRNIAFDAITLEWKVFWLQIKHYKNIF